jgi:DNA (cytosine-5)-methyltransferase 1
MEIVMQFGSVCSGIEAASVAWHPIGWKAAWLAEIEPFPRAVLAHHYPSVPNLGDMTTIARRVLTEEVPAPDVFCGGTPCQAFSVAGLRESLADERGNLTLKFVEIADAIDHVRVGRGEDECIVFWENVPGVLSTSDNAFGCFLAGLAGEDDPLVPPGGKWTNAGCVFGPQRAVAWRVLDAQYFGVAQRRRRVFVVASARKGFDPATVLFEWDGVRRDTAPSREARQVAPTIPARSTAGGGLGTDFDCDGGLQVAGTMKACKDSGGWSNSADHAAAGYMVPVLSQCITTGTGQRYDPETETILPVTHTLRGEGFDASEDGTGRGTPLVPMFLHANKGRPAGRQSAHTEMVSVKPIVETLTTDGHAQSAVAVPVGVTIHGTDPTVQKVASYDELAQCLRARTPGNIDNSSTTVVQQPVAYGIRTAHTSANGWGIQEECTHTLDCAQGVAVAFHPTQDPISSTDGSTHALGCGSTGGQASVAVAVALRGREGGATAELGDEVQNCLRASSGGGDKPHVLAPAVRDISQTLTSNYGKQVDSSDTRLGPNVVFPTMQVRRLTPEECEKLQGFEPGYTAIPWRGKPADQCPDGPRYKALGNSWAIPCVSWIGERIARQINSSTTSPHPAGFFTP